MSQPDWKFIKQLGDVNPIDHGGHFVFVDQTGVYPPEAEILMRVDDEDDPDDEDAGHWMVCRYPLEKCTYQNGVLSDNRFHPDFPAWFAKPESEKKERPQDTTYLSNVAENIGLDIDELIDMFCSDEPVDRAVAYEAIGHYHGFLNLDQYPLEFRSRKEVEKRYKNCLTR